MKRAIIEARRAAAGRMVQQLRRGRKPFYGAHGPAGPKDAKDLRGAKGALLKEAEELAGRDEARGAGAEEGVRAARRAPSRSSSRAARRSGRR